MAESNNKKNEKEKMDDYYKLLGVSNNAPIVEIEKAFRRKAPNYHPDKNPGHPECEELMKKLTRAKEVLCDPEQRAKFDENYTGDGNDNNVLKEFLSSGERHSEAYKRNFQHYKQEYDSYLLVYNYDEVQQTLKQLRKNLMKSRDEIQPYRVSKCTDKYFTYLDSKAVVDIEMELKKRLPSSIWNLGEVQPEERSLFTRAARSVFGCDYLARANVLFAQNQYNQALYSYIKAKDGEALHDKCMALLAENNRACLSYARALMKIDCFGEHAIHALIKWLINNEVDGSDVILLAACAQDKDQQEIKLHEKVLQFLIDKNMPRDLILSTCLYLLKRDKDCALAIKATAQLNDKYHLTDKNKVTEFLYAGNIKDMVVYILDHMCNKAAAVVYMEMTKNQNFDTFQRKYKASLYLLKAACNKLDEKVTECIDSCKVALVACPTDDVQRAICALLGDCAIFDSFALLLIEKHEMKIPTEHSFTGFLRSHSALRSTIRYEESVLRQELSNFDKAMLYIDLSMSAIGTSVFANNYLIAASFLLQEMMSDSDIISPQSRKIDAASKYALREIICQLIANVIHIARTYCNPMTAMYLYEKSLYLMTTAHRLVEQSLELHNTKPKRKQLVSKVQQMLIDTVCNELTRLAKVTPFIDDSLQLSTDLLYLDIVGDEFLEQFYLNQLNKDVPNHPLTNLYKYHLLELNWKNRSDDEQFNRLREDLMDATLKEAGWNTNNVERLLGWPVINRDSNGFIDRQRPWLNITNGTIISVDGVQINFLTGQFKPIFTMSPPGYSGLICFEDALEIFRNGIGSSFFTLDQASLDMQYHCCQEMKYCPKELTGTNFLATLLHADYLLKMFTLGNEVSAKKPFAFQSTCDNLLEGLPEHLRRILTPLQEKENGTCNGQVHRFWIEPCEIFYFTVDETGDSKTFIFFDVKMKVKKHLMKYDKNGELVDDENDDEDDDSEGGEDDNDADNGDADKNRKKEPSPERQFSSEFTKHYDEISEYFPVFARLRELLKLAAITEILKSTAKRLNEARLNLTVDIEPIKGPLEELRKKFREHYPNNTSSNRSKCYKETLRENRIYDDSNVDPSSRERVQRNIREQLEKADEEIIRAVSENLAKSFEIEKFLDRNYSRVVREWMDSGFFSRLIDGDKLATVVATALRDKHAEQLSRFGVYLKSLGFDNLVKEDKEDKPTLNEKSSEYCVYVPAAFKRHENSRVYGGVNMGVALTEATIQNLKGKHGVHGNSKWKMGEYHLYKLVATPESYRKASKEMREIYGPEAYVGKSHSKEVYKNQKYNGLELSKRGNKTAKELTAETGINYKAVIIKTGMNNNLWALCEEAILISRGKKALGKGSGFFASGNKNIPDLQRLLEEAERNPDLVPEDVREKMRDRISSLKAKRGGR